jgi:uncharacterized protein
LAAISDSSPLIYLAALSDFDLLRKLFREVHIPPAVWTETVEQGAGLPGSDAVRNAVTEGWIRVSPVRGAAAPVRHKGQLLHAGEVEVVRLGQQLQAGTLLIDDRLAVHYARSLGFLVMPTIAIYIVAKKRGFVHSIRPKVDRLRDIGFRLTTDDYEAVLTAAGE